MQILADENIDYPIVLGLRSSGFSVATILEGQRGASDAVVLQESVVEKAILLTEDKDFGEHVFRLGSDNAGVILVRLPWNGWEKKLKNIVDCLEKYQASLSDSFTVISPGRIRIRKR